MNNARAAVALGLLGLSCATSSSRPSLQRLTTKQLVDRSKPAIVRIESDFGGGKKGVGTGFFIGSDGRIATNLHVIEGTAEIVVTVLDGTKYAVRRIIDSDRERDLAVIGIDVDKKMPTLELGDSGGVAAGDRVVVIGNPLGVLDYTVSDGLISSVRAVNDRLTVLQISAPISEGSSGGPLFNYFGEVIGVATMIATQGQNLNFGIPSNYLKPLSVAAEGETVQAYFERFEKARSERGERVQVERQIPHHDLAILADCGDDTIAATYQAIGRAIELGAPLYNSGKHEACFRIYEGTAIRLEQDLVCQGLREAIGHGLLRASTVTTYTEKAWAMRDTFDGVLEVVARRARSK